jgi:hypothetical protein
LTEDLLPRLQRNALVCCAVMAAVAVVIARDWRAGLAVAGGGVLIAPSFLSIRGGLDDLTTRRPRTPEDRRPVRFTHFSGVRYDCAFAPAPVWADGGRIFGRRGYGRGGRAASLEQDKDLAR